MSLALPYMGTKRHLAPIVADIICRAKPGVVLDVFSGMCAVGQAIGARRNIWSNDVQCFSSEVASALFTAKNPFFWTERERDYIAGEFQKNAIRLKVRYGKRLAEEKSALQAGELERIRKYLSSARHVANDEALENERGLRSRSSKKTPYNLCSITYADGYFGLLQSIEIDSARFALDSAHTHGVLDDDQFRWLLIALCQAAGRIASTTGHFAQFLTVNANNLSTYLAQRNRSFWDAWMQCSQKSHPIGSALWRKKNRVFNREGLSLLGILGTSKVRPGIVYADPPYTDDQYSRYYHVWETLVKYDYPHSEGAGRYRPDRFQTPFSRVEDVGWAFSELIRRSAALGADLVLSYPKTGLLHRAGHTLPSLIAPHFSKLSLALESPHKHSTMGASKGSAKTHVVEQIYFASNR